MDIYDYVVDYVDVDRRHKYLYMYIYFLKITYNTNYKFSIDKISLPSAVLR